MKDGMSKEEFMLSGYLERYALGELSDAEIIKVKEYLEKYPSLRQELGYMENSLEQIARQNAVEPPTLTADMLTEKITRDTATSKSPSGRSSWNYAIWLGLIAALLYSIWSLFQSHTRLHDQEHAYAMLARECDEKAVLASNRIAIYEHEATEHYRLMGGASKSTCQAVVLWNDNLKTGYLKTHDLPRLSSNETYQIWADKEGVMIPVGLLESASPHLQTLEYIEDAESLNITIEPAGGSEHPSVERLVSSVPIS